MTNAGPAGRRQPWREAPGEGEAGWLALGDDDLLHCMAALPPDHSHDEALLAVLRSDRHFFVRQEAAKRVRDTARLREYSTDRHIGQILVRGMTRRADLAYLERLAAESRHLEVRGAAEAQLRQIAAAKATPGG